MKKDKLLAVIVILLGVIVMAASIVYIVTDRMIPGLIPLCSAVLMVPMILLWRKNENGKLYAFLFMTASILNLIAAVLQIANAL
ncbi:MAG: hypothetical protein IJ001_09920 [Oscillospiraceae bacterium]|nr:hypothetical protein [Oscillospiraceae bacterium]